ncbi:hypothetical protein ACS0TY_036866 [Phlomoides rotata]
MDFLLILLSLFSLFISLASSASFTEFVYPNFTASNLKFVDASGTFLISSNGTFKASMFNPGAQQSRFYLCVIHVESNAVIFSANRDSPVSKSGSMELTASGVRLLAEDGGLKWSTPPFSAPVYSLRLTESGNLQLLDVSNATLWESFRVPTDTIVIGQRLPTNTLLVSSVSNDDLSSGEYEVGLTSSDVVLRWKNLSYWKLSMDPTAFVNSFFEVEFLAVNETGLFLFGQNGSRVVIHVSLTFSKFRVVKIDQSGQIVVVSYSDLIQKRDFSGPVDECRIPFICGKVGLCAKGISPDNPVCTCPVGFRTASNNKTTCVVADSSLSLPDSCNSSSNHTYNSSKISYLQLGSIVDYFANDFTQPSKYGVNLSQCQDLCSQDCACLAFFHDNSSSSCYKLEDSLGSMMLRTTSDGRLGYVKTIVRAPPHGYSGFDDKTGFPTIAVVLLPLSGAAFILAVALLLWRRWSREKMANGKRGFEDLEFSIPGLPLRFDYEELEAATENFKTKIGTGGFGTVYKGMLPDKTLVAVKRIMNLGSRGKKDFCTEIGVIGNIHHVNLVKLKGFCAQRKQWLLVYEYMNRGSLDKTLFGNGPVLEWGERVEIALGAARGLAYLHNGCDQKIIHCDVKPENILLHDHFQAKISDFGLSKLLNREESSQFTTMRGTRGYLAPEWLTSSAISNKTDVYSFGMVLLELVSGRKNCLTRTRSHSQLEGDSSSGGNSMSSSVHELLYFPLFALEMHEQRRYLELVDAKLTGRVASEDVEKLVRLALCCVHEEPGLRPSMASIVGMLEGEVPVGDTRIGSLNFLRFYGRRIAEASMAEETGRFNGVIAYPNANVSHISSNGSVSNVYSYISSQQVSGPR